MTVTELQVISDGILLARSAIRELAVQKWVSVHDGGWCMRKVHAILSTFVAFGLIPSMAFAVPKPPGRDKPPAIDPSLIQSVDVEYKLNKKGPTLHKTVQCYNGTAGVAKTAGSGMSFTSFQSQAKSLRKKDAPAKKVKLTQVLSREGKEECRALSDPGSGVTPVPGTPSPTSTPTPIPARFSLEPYSGPFGEAQARTLYERVAFAGSPAEIAEAVQSGLAATVTKLTTHVAQPELDAYETDLRCDGKVAGDPMDKPCSTTKRNELYLPGFRYGLYARFQHSRTPFFERLFLFLHDERIAVSSNVLRQCEYFALTDYVGKVRKAAESGDYIQYARDLNDDHLANLIWLDGAVNRNISPNENWAREAWEIMTVGASRNGVPNYTGTDIAQAALAFTGWTIDNYTINGENVCLPSFVPGFHAQGSFTVFGGTPYQAQVNTAEDMLRASFTNPNAALSLSEDMLREMVVSEPPEDMIAKFAVKLRELNFNVVEGAKVLMFSEAMHADENRKTIIKHPWDLLFGFLRQTGIPVDYTQLDETLTVWDQRPLLPDTVFGWNPKKLAGESYQLDRTNEFIRMLTADKTVWLDKYHYDFYNYFLGTLPASTSPATTLVERLSTWLNVPLNEAQRTVMADTLNFDFSQCNQNCNGQAYTLIRNAFDPYPTSLNWDKKLRKGILELVMSDGYALK